MRRRLLAPAALAIALSLFALSTASAAASGNYLGGAAGYDISWPQCGGPYPGLPAGQFGIVGINGGRPYTMNPCFESEYRWAGSSGLQPTLYINLDYGETADGPRSCAADDHGCLAYNYGFGAARFAFDAAWDETGGAASSVPVWWLDVEIMNVWSDNSDQNAMVVLGAIDYLKLQERTPGVYSTPYQWGTIVGGFAPDGVVGWVAGGYDETDLGKCGQALWGGGATVMFQYLTGDFDQNIPC